MPTSAMFSQCRSLKAADNSEVQQNICLCCIIYFKRIILFSHISNGGNMGENNLQNMGQEVVEVIFGLSARCGEVGEGGVGVRER
jgi:hypothetical protein